MHETMMDALKGEESAEQEAKEWMKQSFEE